MSAFGAIPIELGLVLLQADQHVVGWTGGTGLSD
jgi:hypothetical protein